MADFNVIRDVSLTLRTVLTDGLKSLNPTPGCALWDFASAPANQPVLTLALYDTIEDPSARNRPNRRIVQQSKISIKRPPVALLLRYLITPWSGTPDSDHQIIGRAIQILYDNAIVSGAKLIGSLFAANEAIKLTMVPLTLEDRTHVWRSVDLPYRLSANYEVRVINIEPEKETLVDPVRSRRLDFGEVEEEGAP